MRQTEAENLLEEIEGLFDEQTYDERRKESREDEPDEAEYCVNVTVGLMRRITKALNGRKPFEVSEAMLDAAWVKMGECDDGTGIYRTHLKQIMEAALSANYRRLAESTS